MSEALRAKLRRRAEQQADEDSGINYFASVGESAAERSALDEVTTYCPEVICAESSLPSSASREECEIDRRLRALDVQRGAERMRRLPYVTETVDKWERIAGAKTWDAARTGGATHVAELRRRQRKQTYIYLSSLVRGDHSLLSVWDPLWRQRWMNGY